MTDSQRSRNRILSLFVDTARVCSNAVSKVSECPCETRLVSELLQAQLIYVCAVVI